MTKASEKRKGEIYIFMGGFLWAFFPIITILSYAKIPSMISLAWSTFFSAIFFAALVTVRGKWYEILDLELWGYALRIAIFIGLLFYSFYFFGLTRTTAGNSSVVALFDVFTSFMLFHIVKKEHFSLEHVFGSILMVVGAGVVLLPNFRGFQTGDLFIIIATLFTPIGNWYQRKARKKTSSEMIMFLRSGLSTPLLFLLAFFFGQSAPLSSIQLALPFLLINGILLFGLSKLFWIEAIHRIPVAKAVALSSMNPFLTLLLAWFILKEAPSVWQFAALVPMVIGVLLLTDQFIVRKKTPKFLEDFLITEEGV